jgi:hypothetical protein
MKTNNGWIKLHRQIVDDELWFSEPFTRAQAWIDILLIANHKKRSFYVRGNKINVDRGQFAYGEEALALRWKWSRNKVRRYLDELETIQQIGQQKNRVLSIYTVLNYNRYQSDDTTKGTTERQQTIQQKDINKNIYKNVENSIPNSLQLTAQIVEELSEKFNLSPEVISRESAKCVDFHKSRGTKVKDWLATFRNWLRKHNEFEASKIPPATLIQQQAEKLIDQSAKETDPSKKAELEDQAFKILAQL